MATARLLPSPLLKLIAPVRFRSPPTVRGTAFILGSLCTSYALGNRFYREDGISPFVPTFFYFLSVVFYLPRSSYVRERVLDFT